jgi:hypothetical protein
MIGIIFFVVISVWALVALVLGFKLPQWLGMRRNQSLWTVVFVVLVFFAPVADEILAYPQIKVLCKQDRLFNFSPGMDAKKAYGRTVYSEEREMFTKLFPSSIEVIRWTTVYVDATTKEEVFKRSGIHPQRGMLGVPSGSSGGQMTVLLSPCEPTGETFDSQGIPSRFSQLNLTKIPN